MVLIIAIFPAAITEFLDSKGMYTIGKKGGKEYREYRAVKKRGKERKRIGYCRYVRIFKSS